MKVIKRDGTLAYFNIQKIVDAITKALLSTDGAIHDPDLAEEIASEIAQKNITLSVEEIQNMVEQKLIGYGRADVAKNYSQYRENRQKQRARNSALIKQVMKRIKANDVENANANVDEHSFSGREKEASADIQKAIALDYILSPEVAEAHRSMLVYQHDLEKTNVGAHNCLFIDFEKLFNEGFRTRNGDIRPPSSFSTACQQTAVIKQCQSQVQFGGVGALHIDYDLAPFVKKSFKKHLEHYFSDVEETPIDPNELEESIGEICLDNKKLKEKFPKAYRFAQKQLEREGRQSTEALFHNLNTLESRSGSQVPFSSINYGRDMSTEGKLVIKWLLEASLSGIGKHHLTPIFPISIFQYKSGVNAEPGTPGYESKQLALKSLSKRIYPNFANCDWSQAHEDPEDKDTFFGTMGCRTLVGYDRFTQSYNRIGRGNNVPNTIILPKLGIEYGICLGQREKPDLEGFWQTFEKTLALCEKSLLERFDIMTEQTPAAAPFMYQNGTIKEGQSCRESTYQALRHNTLAMGYIGVAEMCQALFGANHAESQEAYDFALSVVKRINEYAKEASERNNLNFSCYATPSEGLCSTALLSLRKQYGVIPNVTDREFLTNSHHIPVWVPIGIFKKLELEAPFCQYPTGGCITYIELDSTFIQNTKAVEQIIDYAFKELDIPYLAFNFPIDSCLDCGYQSEFNDVCPECGSENIQQLRRVTGYLSSDYRNFNRGKQAETLARVKHSHYE